MKLRKLAAFGMAMVMAASLASTVAFAEEVDRSGELIIYSNSTSNGQDEWILDVAKEAGFNIQIVSIEGAELSDRLVAEKNNPVCDVVFGLNAVEWERLKGEDLLVKYEPTWVDEVDMTLGDADGYYYPTVVQPLLLAYNKDVVTDPPKDWPDLCDPKYNKQYNLLQLTGGTAKMILGSLLARYPDPDGEYGVSDEGWEMIEQFYANGYYQQDGDDYIGNVVDGSVPMTELWGAGVIRYQAERDIEFGIMLPEIGEPFVVEQVGIISGCDNVDLAVDFINWFGSADIQKGWSDSVGAIPANENALAAIDNQEIKDLMATVSIQDVDWGFVAEHINDWAEKVQLEYLE